MRKHMERRKEDKWDSTCFFSAQRVRVIFSAEGAQQGDGATKVVGLRGRFLRDLRRGGFLCHISQP